MIWPGGLEGAVAQCIREILRMEVGQSLLRDMLRDLHTYSKVSVIDTVVS